MATTVVFTFKVVQCLFLCTAGLGWGAWCGNRCTRIPLHIILNCIYFLMGTFGLLSLALSTLLKKTNKQKKSYLNFSSPSQVKSCSWHFPLSCTSWSSLARAAWVCRRRGVVGRLGLSWSVRWRVHLIVVGVWRRTWRKQNFVQQVKGFNKKLGLSFHSRFRRRKSGVQPCRSLMWLQHHLVDKSINCNGFSPNIQIILLKN